MSTMNYRIKVRINYKSISNFRSFLKEQGFEDFVIGPSMIDGSFYLYFENDEDSIIFILKDIQSKFQEIDYDYTFEPDIDLSDKLEKKLKTYNKFDDIIIRKLMKS